MPFHKQLNSILVFLIFMALKYLEIMDLSNFVSTLWMRNCNKFLLSWHSKDWVLFVNLCEARNNCGYFSLWIFYKTPIPAEQEEYAREGIQWTPIDFFNNIVVCDLIESKRPPGIFSITDDVTKQVGNKEHGVAETLLGKVSTGVQGLEGGDRHYAQRGHAMFMITHYAGAVNYNAEGFVEKNRDQVFVDLLEMCKKSTNPFVQLLFKNIDPSKKQQTQGSIIRNQANKLVDT